MKKSLAVLALSTLMTTGAAYAQTNDNPQPNTTDITVSTQAAVSPITISINGESIHEHGYLPLKGTEPMLPLRAVAERLGFTLVWNQENLSVDLNKNTLFTTVKTGEDHYTINKMFNSLGAAPELLDNKLYVPSFVNKVLHGSASTQGNTVSITLEEQQKKVQTTGVITSIKPSGDQASIHTKGVGTEGIVLNVSKDTVYRMLDDTKLGLSDLHVSLTVSTEHSMAATLSLPPQTPASKITVLDAKLQADLIGTAGEIAEVRSDNNGTTGILIKGVGLTDQSPSGLLLKLVTTKSTHFGPLRMHIMQPSANFKEMSG
ncbi:stalk domain-containing protein [Paenibacillus sp. GCM10027628]|uniref:stalk domain-containing protein n=1 Tax=Paenibacillus sp. GCM10027628 TaxID=3273413 RepID=UPI00363985EF